MVNLTARDLSEKYNRFAYWYDWIEGVLNLLGVKRLRRDLLRGVHGTVLEVAIGTGKNLPFYRDRRGIIAVDLSRTMLNIARRRAARVSIDVSFLLADAEALPFRDKSFDTVVSSLSTCTFPNPLAALEEMARVCQGEGKVLLLEHGRSDRARLGRWQDRHEDKVARRFGCHWNREPLELVGHAGMKVVSARRSLLGIFHEIEAGPRRS